MHVSLLIGVCAWPRLLLSAIACLHQQDPPIAHRDLKLENLLFTGDGKVLKLCDFGSATTRQ